MMRDWTNYDRAHDFSPCNSVQCSKGLGKELGLLISSPLTDRQMFYISMNCNVPYTPAILSGSVTFLEHFHPVFVCFRYVTQISVPVPVPVTFLGDLPGRKSGLRIAGGRKMPMWSRDYSSKWHFLQAGNMLKMMIKMLMVMVTRLGVKVTFFARHRPTEQCLLAP